MSDQVKTGKYAINTILLFKKINWGFYQTCWNGSGQSDLPQQLTTI